MVVKFDNLQIKKLLKFNSDTLFWMYEIVNLLEMSRDGLRKCVEVFSYFPMKGDDKNNMILKFMN